MKEAKKTIASKLDQKKDEIIKMIKDGASTSSVAQIYECNPGTIWHALKRWGISPNKKRSSNYGKVDKRKEEIISLYKDGKSAYQISKEIGIDKTTILRNLKKWGIDTSEKYKGDPDNLLKNKKDDVIKMFESGISMRQIAKQLGYSDSSIYRILQDSGINTTPEYIPVDESFFEKIDNQHKAYILGFWYADGNVTNNLIRVGITDIEVLEYIKEQMKFEGEIRFKGRKKSHHKDQYELNITRAKLANDLKKLGCVEAKAKILKFPTDDIVPPSLLHHFVRGYFDGDGSFSQGGCFVGSYDFIYALKDKLPCEITNIYQRYKNRPKEDSAHQLYIGKAEENKKFVKWLYKDAEFYLKRKYEKGKVWLMI